MSWEGGILCLCLEFHISVQNKTIPACHHRNGLDKVKLSGKIFFCNIRRKELKNAVDELRKQLSKPTKKASTISVLKAAQQEIQVCCAC